MCGILVLVDCLYFGCRVAWIIGWGLILEYTVGGSTVARGIAPNLVLNFFLHQCLIEQLLMLIFNGSTLPSEDFRFALQFSKETLCNRKSLGTQGSCFLENSPIDNLWRIWALHANFQ